MRAWSRFWQQMASRAVRHAWGLASDGDDWVLVGLALQRSEGVRVQAIERISSTATGHIFGNFSEGLAQLNAVKNAPGRRLNLALRAEEFVSGILELPAHLSSEDWAVEVQMEVSQLLGLAPEEVSFDFQPDPLTEGLLSRVHWVGCDQALIKMLKNSTRSAGWQLHSVEPAWHAAHRAASRLQGGLASLLTQAPQDWQFNLTGLANASAEAPSVLGEFGPHSELRQAMASHAGPRLVASGLALKAWL